MTPTRPIPECLKGGEIWNDVPAKIVKAMGGREFFFEEEATNIHRIGIGNGLGWRLPRYVQRPDRVDHIKVERNQQTGLLDMTFLRAGDAPPAEAEKLKLFTGMQYADLLLTYQLGMYGDQ